jgi:dTDP-glucose pyrophosphorylase
MRPKYLLCDYLGRSMIQLAAEPYLADHTVHIVILKEHEDKYNVTSQLKSMFGTLVNIIILENRSAGPADTVYQALNKIVFTNDQNFIVKDCDSIFSHKRLSAGNKIFVDTLDNKPTLRNPNNKSYIICNNWGIINNIVEKKIVSNTFCVGGYQFNNINMYKDAYETIKQSKLGEIYISSIIDYLISREIVFTTQNVKNYIDLGTIEDWESYNNKPSLFIDIDGTIVDNQSLHGNNNYNIFPTILENNVKTLIEFKDNGCQLIFTTSRPEKFEQQTRNLLNKLGFIDCKLIMGMHHSHRILVNDFAPSNSYPSAIAINLPRNSDTLEDYLKQFK